MIKSFLPSATVFTTNGERIIQAVKCIEHRELGDWYIDLVAPLEYQSYLEKDYILVVPTKEKGDQPFRINNPKITDKVDVRAYHIGFDTRNYAVELSTVVNGNAQACLDELNTNIDGTHPFTFTSTISTLKSFSVVDSSLYNALIQIADEYNGVLDFNGWNVTISSSIGADNGVILAYGKNIQESEINENWDLVVTKLKPIGNNGITLTPVWLTADVSYDRPYTKIMNFDTDSLSNLALVSQLYLDRYKVPRVNYKVKADVEQNVALGDAITVNARQFTTTAEVLAYDYNVLSSRVVVVEFGNYRPTLKQFLNEKIVESEEKAVKRAQLKIDEATGEIEAWAENEITLAVGTKEDIFYKQDTEPFENEVLNGDITSSTSWSTIITGVGITPTFTDGIITLLPNGGVSVAFQTFTPTTDIYYFKFKYRHDSTVTDHARTRDGSTNRQVFNLPASSSFTDYSFITNGTQFDRIFFGSATNNTATYLEFDEVIGVNLTSLYGAGNEPSKAEMDETVKRIWLDTTTGTYKSFRGGGWLPASELKGSKFILDNDGAKFYGDGFKLFNNAAELKVFFDLVKDAFNLSINANMPIYEPTGITELVQIMSGGTKGLQFGEPDIDGWYKAYITAVNMKTISGLLEDLIRLRIRSTERLELYGDKGVVINSDDYIFVNRGIQFPSTQVPSTDVNTLDDYKEVSVGTWEPTLIGQTTAGAATYTTRLGKYTKIGNVVHFVIQLVWTAHTGTGALRISNLPFTSANDGMSTPCSIVSSALTYSGQLEGLIPPNTTFINLHNIASNTALGNTAMDTTGTVYIQGTYMV